jgi:hypothetical protein
MTCSAPGLFEENHMIIRRKDAKGAKKSSGDRNPSNLCALCDFAARNIITFLI